MAKKATKVKVAKEAVKPSEESKKDIIIRMLQEGKYTAEEIVEVANASILYFRCLCHELRTFAKLDIRTRTIFYIEEKKEGDES